ncbi:phosphate/phosphite/phosphonate ABC transporter substrate-binding protein [Vibrio maritimus]|uniref:phosphate/phosphite/phosphonate ABC transporter substrate-binding protein n=1 Tax=Vibrio maritimus TaxID=990268 RepID=UPI0040679905
MKYIFCLILTMTLALSSHVFATPSNNGAKDQTFTIGVLSNKARKHIVFSFPLAKYVSQGLTEYGYTNSRVKVTDSIFELGQWLESGEVDMVSETLFAALKLQEDYQGDIVLRRWKKGQPEYQTVFFARKDSGIQSLDDLYGKILVLEDRSSTSGFYMPIQSLLSHQLEVTPHFSLPKTPTADKVNIVLASDILRRADEISLSTWVAHSQADVGAFANTNWEDSGDMPPHIKPGMEIIHRTEFVPRSVILLRGDLDANVRSAIIETLVNANKSEEGKAALYKFQKTTKFDRLSKERLQSLADYNQSRVQIEQLWLN